MALTNATADALAQAFCTAEGITDATAVAKWKAYTRLIYSHLLTDLTITAAVPAGSIASTGGSGPYVGPAAPVPCTVLVT